MCRLAIFGGIGEFKSVARALHQLEISMGGDGNGYYQPDPAYPEMGMSNKGIDLTTAEVAFDSYDRAEPTYFHTRYATAGGIKSEICHPFVAGSVGMLMHNGHWHHWRTHNNKDEISDTQTAARIVGENGIGVLRSKSFDYSGIWIIANESGAYLMVRGGTFYFQWTKDGGYFHASEIIDYLDISEVQIANEGEVYFVANDGSVTMVSDSVETVKMPRGRSKKQTKKTKTFSGSTETHELSYSETWDVWDQIDKDERLEIAAKADRLGIHSLTDWEVEQLEELDRQLEDDEFFSNIKPTSWDD
jgi:hypothetical protein